MGHKEILQGERKFPIGSRITLLDSTQSHTPQRANRGRHNDSTQLFPNYARQLPGPLESNNDSRPPSCRETKVGRMLPILSFPPRNLAEPLLICGEGKGAAFCRPYLERLRGVSSARLIGLKSWLFSWLCVSWGESLHFYAL